MDITNAQREEIKKVLHDWGCDYYDTIFDDIQDARSITQASEYIWETLSSTGLEDASYEIMPIIEANLY